MRLLRLSATAVLLLVFTATLAVAGSSNATDSAAVTPPVAVIPVSHHEFEPVVDGTEVTYAFAIRNTGDGPLVIQQVKTG